MKALHVLAASGLLAVTITSLSLADEQAGRINRDGVALRSRPNPRAPTWTPARALSKDAQVWVAERVGGFYRITTTAFVDDRYVRQGVVTASSLNVRCEPRIQPSTAIDWRKRGDLVKVVAQRGHWLMIETSAFVPTDAVTLQTDAPQDPPAETTKVDDVPEGLPLDLDLPKTSELDALTKELDHEEELNPIDDVKLKDIDELKQELSKTYDEGTDELVKVPVKPLELPPVKVPTLEPVKSIEPQTASATTLEAQPFAGEYVLEDTTLLHIERNANGYDVARTTPDGQTLKGFGDLDDDTLKVSFAQSRGFTSSLQAAHATTDGAAPCAEYEVQDGGRKIKGKFWAQGRRGKKSKEQGYRQESIAPLTGSFTLEPGYLFGKKPIRVTIEETQSGAVRVTRETLRDGKWTDHLEGFGHFEGRKLQVALQDAQGQPVTPGHYEVHEDGRIEGGLDKNDWGESGWRDASVAPLTGRFRLAPSWYAFGYRPAVLLSVSRTGDGFSVRRQVIDRRAGRSSVRVGTASLDGRTLKVQFSDGSSGSYEIHENGEVDGSFQDKAEDGWRSLN